MNRAHTPAVAESKSVVVFANHGRAKTDSATLRDVAALTKEHSSGHMVVEVFQPEMGAAIMVSLPLMFCTLKIRT